MSDSEDDYMSDKLLQQCEKHDTRPGLVFNRTTKRQYELDKKRQELHKKHKSHKTREEELREEGLNTAISSDNKGFKLLEKMGFKAGEGLGKTKSGRVEPIKVEVKLGKSGIGVESKVKEKIKADMDKISKQVVMKAEDFKRANRERMAERYLQKDFYTAQKVCEDLDLRKDIEEPVEEYYWTWETIKKRRKVEEEDEEEFYEEFRLKVTEENLQEIICYLRSRHLYCLFCAFVATDEQDLQTSCPGPFRPDHDEG